MGKTGSVNWMQVKGVNAQIRLVPEKDANVKKPGPNQRFKGHAVLKKLERYTREGESQGSRGGAGRSGGRGGRGRRGGRGAGKPDPRFRRRITRSKSSMLGSKQKAKK
ncbi:MAG: DUF5350 domain-containing protein [Methanomicrobiales archaeon]|nr:DUF5350 domain-containing protein [Methanomicrobiales archaeon]